MAATPIAMPAFATWFATLPAAMQADYNTKPGIVDQQNLIEQQYNYIITQAPTSAHPPSLYCDTAWIVCRSDVANHWLRNALAASLG